MVTEVVDQESVSFVRELAKKLQEHVERAIDPAFTRSHGMAALELVSARISLEMDEHQADETRANAAELFEAAAATDLEELAARNLTPWAGSPWDDEPIPYELTNCPVCEQPIPCACELP